MRTPIRYAGGKSKAFDFISTYIPFWPRPKEIVSPFFGGGSLEVRWAHEMGIRVKDMMYLVSCVIIGNIKSITHNDYTTY